MPDHFINSIKLDFSFQEKEKENALSKSRQIFEEKILPKLNGEFDKIVDDIYIEHLEIFIGETTESEFAHRFEKAFMESWAKRSIKVQEKSFSTLQNGQTERDPFIYFLEKGYWPWNYQARDHVFLLEYIKDLFRDPQRSRVLFDWIRVQPVYIQVRLVEAVWQREAVTENFIQALMHYHRSLQMVPALLMVLLKQPASFNDAWKNLVFPSLLSVKPLENARELFTWLKELEIKLVEFIWPTGNKWKKIHDEILVDNMQEGGNIELRSIWRRIEKLLRQADDVLLPGGETHVKDELSILYHKEENDKIGIDNAGLILLHPFLPQVFRDLKWINAQNEFFNARHQQKAILFLQYLVNGKSRQPEHTLPLNKIICGWPLHLPLNLQVNFSTVEKNTAEELLDSLKEYWKPLKNTSREGLVQSFIARNGLLKVGDHDYLLQVEKKTIDILLEDLPFGIQTIKLPWNEKLIHCEWNY